MNSLLISLCTDSFYLAIFFITITIVATAVMCLSGINKTILRLMDFLWILVSFIAIIKLTSDIRPIVIDNLLETATARVEKDKSALTTQLSFIRYRACGQFQKKTNFSPDDYDKKKSQFDYFCNWAKKNIAIKNDDTNKYIENEDIFSTIKSLHNSDLLGIINKYKELKNTYLTDQKYMNDLKLKSKKTDAEENIYYISPLVISIALSLRLVKYIGDILLEKKTNTERKNNFSLP